MPASRVRDTDKGYRALLKRVKAEKLTLTVGIQDEEAGATYESGMTVGQVATIHEYGLGGMPSRSFIRAWFDENRATNKALIKNLAIGVAKGYIPSAHVALDQAGQVFVGGMQAKISSGIAPPNKPATIRRKGSSVPLVNTGQLRSSIRHKVLDGDAAVSSAGGGAGGGKGGKSKGKRSKLAVKVRRLARSVLRSAKQGSRKGKAAFRQVRRNLRKEIRKGVRDIKRDIRGTKRDIRKGLREVKRGVRNVKRDIRAVTKQARAAKRSVMRLVGIKRRRNA